MKAFIHNGELYLRCIPSKMLFRSTMVHEVVNRGDIFAMNVKTQEFTIIPGKSEVEHIEVQVLTADQKMVGLEAILLGTSGQIANQNPLDTPGDSGYTTPSKSQAAELKRIRNDLAEAKFGMNDWVRSLSWSGAAAAQIRGTQWNQERCMWQYSLRGFSGFFLETDLIKVGRNV